MENSMSDFLESLKIYNPLRIIDLFIRSDKDRIVSEEGERALNDESRMRELKKQIQKEKNSDNPITEIVI